MKDLINEGREIYSNFKRKILTESNDTWSDSDIDKTINTFIDNHVSAGQAYVSDFDNVLQVPIRKMSEDELAELKSLYQYMKSSNKIVELRDSKLWKNKVESGAGLAMRAGDPGCSVYLRYW